MYICQKCGLEFTNKGGWTIHQTNCKLSKIDIITIKDQYLNLQYSIRDLKKEYNLSSSIIERILKGITRTQSEARNIASEKFSFKHSDESKEKMKIARLKYMKEHPENTAWRTSTISYPEKVFKEYLEKYEYDNKYYIIREYSMFPFFIDFAFINEKLAIEIDGSQHLLEERKLSDDKKDSLLLENNWSILRFTAKEIQTNIDECFEKINNVLSNNIQVYEKVGIYTNELSSKLVDRNEFGYSEKQIERYKNRRKVERPSKEILITDIENLGYTGTGKKYGVSDNCIRKWIKINIE